MPSKDDQIKALLARVSELEKENSKLLSENTQEATRLKSQFETQYQKLATTLDKLKELEISLSDTQKKLVHSKSLQKVTMTHFSLWHKLMEKCRNTMKIHKINLPVYDCKHMYGPEGIRIPVDAPVIAPIEKPVRIPVGVPVKKTPGFPKPGGGRPSPSLTGWLQA